MAKEVKSIKVDKYTVTVRSTRHSAGAKAEYFVEVYLTRSGFGLDDYDALVGYYPNTISTKSRAITVAQGIAEGNVQYRGFMCGQLSMININPA
jgi:hypothetical protein